MEEKFADMRLGEESDDAVYEKVAKKLEEKCRLWGAFDFYKNLRKIPVFCQNLTEIASQKTFKNVTYKKIDANLGQMQEMALDFFHVLDEELCESVWRVLEDAENTTLFVKEPSEVEGVNAVGLLLQEDYHKKEGKKKESRKIEILLQPRSNAHGLVTVAHELAHTMEERVQKKKPSKTLSIAEIVPMFVERIYADYLFKIGKIDQEERDNIFKDIQNTYIRNARTIVEENEILSQLSSPISAKELKNLDEKYQGSPRRKILLNRMKIMLDGKNGKEVYGEKQFRYIVGEIVSQELYKDFQKEPEKTIQRVKKFAQNNASITAHKGFEMLLGENYEDRLSVIFGRRKN